MQRAEHVPGQEVFTCTYGIAKKQNKNKRKNHYAPTMIGVLRCRVSPVADLLGVKREEINELNVITGIPDGDQHCQENTPEIKVWQWKYAFDVVSVQRPLKR